MKATIIPSELESGEFQPYFKTYIDLAGDRDVMESLVTQLEELKKVFADVDEEVAATIHPPFQWTLKQVVGHLIDGEKIFGCRAHRIACQEGAPLPGFDQDVFVNNSSYDSVEVRSLVREFELIRLSNIMMFDRWSPVMWQQSGICDGKNISVCAIACLLVGHVCHHLNIVKSRLAS